MKYDNLESLTKYKLFCKSETGIRLKTQSIIDATNFFFNLNSGSKNSKINELLTAAEIYQTINLSSSLSISVDGIDYTLYPYLSNISDHTALEIFSDLQKAIECSLLKSAFIELESTSINHIAGTETNKIVDVSLTDLIGDYEDAEEIEEWHWIEQVACYKHRKNLVDGVWEFIINLSYELNDIPDTLKPFIDEATNAGYRYILFHHNT